MRIIISDLTLTGHPEDIKAAILAGYGTGLSGDDIFITNWSFQTAIEYADANGLEAVIRSTTGLTTYMPSALYYYQKSGIMSFIPLGSNNHILISHPESIPSVVTCGASEGTENETAYGPGLEFFDDDNDGNPGVDASSFSNGIILGKLLKIKDTLSCTWWEARYRARVTASESGIWDSNNGYGKINVSAAIAWSGTVPEDPYAEAEIPDPVDPYTDLNVGYLQFKGNVIENKPTLRDREIWIDKTNKKLIVKIDGDEYFVSLTLGG